jgi:hypothetical protein
LRLTFAALDPLFQGVALTLQNLPFVQTANGTFLKRHPAVPAQSGPRVMVTLTTVAKLIFGLQQ